MSGERLLVDLAEDRRRGDLGNSLHPRAPRIGVMLHYDGSVTDTGSLAWLLDPRCRLGYNVLVWDDGRAFEIIDLDRRAPHAGKTRSSDPVRLSYPNDLANSAFYGLAIAATHGDRVTDAAKGKCLWIAVRLFQHHGWSLAESWRLTSHHLEAWPRGRKVDVVGLDPAHPAMDIAEMRRWLETAR